jgi:hypothetical protein
MTKMLSHSDGVSGTTVFNDGTKVHWTEGRGSDQVAILPNGTEVTVGPIGPWEPEERQIIDEELRIEENGADEYRAMTPEEEKEWENARYPDGRHSKYKPIRTGGK